MKIGDEMIIPAQGKLGCGHQGRVIWISEDGKTVAAKCTISHLISGKSYYPVYLIALEEGEG